MSMKDRRSAGRSFSEPDQEGKAKYRRLHPTRDRDIQGPGEFKLCILEDELGKRPARNKKQMWRTEREKQAQI